MGSAEISSELSSLIRDVKNASNSSHAILLQRFFKTAPGEYGAGDIFAGLKVPVQRSIAAKYKTLPLNDLAVLIKSKIHEERLIALFILISQYRKESPEGKEKIFRFYIKNRKKINNWDLVDLSAPNIVGTHLLDKEKGLLYEYAHSKDLWEKRIAILSTYTFIKNGDLFHTFAISDILLHDKHDLIHKGVGWMLREAGKRDYAALEEFLLPRYNQMPRTMLRYSIEKFPEKRRQEYLAGLV